LIAAFAFARPLAAWWDDDQGNRALLEGHAAEALASFDAALRNEPSWSLLHEDRGRALLARAPAAALEEFRRAACGSPCLAEEGDALEGLGRTKEAVALYIAAKAVGKVNDAALRLAARKDYKDALDIESSLRERLTGDIVERSDLASVLAVMGKIDARAAAASPHEPQAGAWGRAAIEAFARASQLAPLNEDYLLSYAFAQWKWGDKRAAAAGFERLLQIHPGQPEAVAALARLKPDESQGP
jgi:predicted Zn-dependent protease